MRATFGILVSRDAGKTWRYLCERAFGYEGTWDPPIAATRDGRLWVGLENGIASTVDGCEVTPSPELAGETVKDLTTDARGETLWVITGAPGQKSWIWRRRGTQFERLGGLDDTNFMTIEVAASKASRVYVTGQPYGTVRGRLYRSDDGGTTLKGDANDLATEGPFFIAAVDPKDADRVLLRHLHTTGSDVLVTKDAGKTFQNVLSMKSAMYGFAKSDDGKTYWAASGLAVDGIWRSVDRGETWEPLAKHGVLCLDWVPHVGLFVCENPFTLGAPAIGLSTDAGRSVVSVATFADIAGPIACPAADAGGALCASTWSATRAQIIPRIDAGSRAAADAGAPAARPSSKCGCRVVGGATGPDRVWLIAGALALAAWFCARILRGSRLIQDGARATAGHPPDTAQERIFPEPR